jgi:hypothetical protein
MPWPSRKERGKAQVKKDRAGKHPFGLFANLAQNEMNSEQSNFDDSL